MSIRLAGPLKELRIHLCQTSKSSQGVREWIATNYVNLKKENPIFPILIRECNGVQPRVWARYAQCYGNCQKSSQYGLSVVAKRARPVILKDWLISPETEKGAESSSALTNLSSADVTNAIKQLVK